MPCVGRRQPSSTKDSDGQVSPTSNGARLNLSPSVSPNTSMREHAMSDLLDYRRDLAILDPAGGRSSRNQQNNPATGSLGQTAPWMTTNSSTASAPTLDPIPTTFYNDSEDNLSLNSQLSPGLRTSISRPTPAGSTESPDAAYFTDERRPSVASITTTASSQGSRASGPRGGIRKLQGFFGEEFPGRDSSEISLPHPGAGKEHRSHSYSYNRPHRDRNYSSATDHGRDGSPASRPRTPVPAPEVVPFLYQEADVGDPDPTPDLSLETIFLPLSPFGICLPITHNLAFLQPSEHFFDPRPNVMRRLTLYAIT
jgi:adenylate cyclase